MKTKAVTIKTAGIRFTADLAVSESVAFPGKEMVDASDLMLLEKAVARWLITHGVRAPETIKYLRSAAGLSGSQLAELLGTARARVSDWENGKADPGVALWNTVADLAMDAIEGSTRTVDRLRATQTEQPIISGEVRLAV